MIRSFIILISIFCLSSCGRDEYYNLAIYYGKQGNHEKAIEINPQFDLAYSNMGNAYRLLFEFDKACKSWQKALALGNEKCKEKIEMNCK